jgi:hypothetical protein
MFVGGQPRSILQIFYRAILSLVVVKMWLLSMEAKEVISWNLKINLLKGISCIVRTLQILY